jgi:DEAD/DEAH box helicase domain-containing protein
VSIEKANELDNLITLCPNCHRLAELNIKIRSALSGLKYLLTNLAPLLVLCESSDLGAYADPNAKFADMNPVILIYDAIPAGIGLSNSLYERIQELLEKCSQLANQCECQDGCPSCVGPSSEMDIGGKKETIYLLNLLLSGAE